MRGLINRILSALADERYFKPGDTYIAVGRFGGLMTSASQQMQFSVNLPKNARYVTNVTINEIVGGIRITTGGYADNVGDGVTWAGRSGISFGGAIYNDDNTVHQDHDKDAYVVTANISKTSAFKQNGTSTNVVNNTPVTLGGRIKMTFS